MYAARVTPSNNNNCTTPNMLFFPFCSLPSSLACLGVFIQCTTRTPKHRTTRRGNAQKSNENSHIMFAVARFDVFLYCCCYCISSSNVTSLDAARGVEERKPNCGSYIGYIFCLVLRKKLIEKFFHWLDGCTGTVNHVNIK